LNFNLFNRQNKFPGFFRRLFLRIPFLPFFLEKKFSLKIDNLVLIIGEKQSGTIYESPFGENSWKERFFWAVEQSSGVGK